MLSNKNVVIQRVYRVQMRELGNLNGWHPWDTMSDNIPSLSDAKMERRRLKKDYGRTTSYRQWRIQYGISRTEWIDSPAP